MARIEGTGETPKRRWRRPSLRVRVEPLVLVIVLSPIVLWAPDHWLGAIALAGVIQIAWSRGHTDGVNDMAEAVRRELRSDAR